MKCESRPGRDHSEAVVELACGRYDLVVFDVSLASAEELTVLLWLGDRYPRTPVIGTLHEEIMLRARECALEFGMRLLLVKPYRLPALLDAARYTLTTSQSDVEGAGRQRGRPRGRYGSRASASPATSIAKPPHMSGRYSVSIFCRTSNVTRETATRGTPTSSSRNS